MSLSSGHRTRSLPLINSGDQPHPSHAATCAHRRPYDRRCGLRGFILRRSALRCAGPAM